MKTKIFTGLNVDFKNIVAISEIVKERVPPKGKWGSWTTETVFYIYLKHVPTPVRHEFVYTHIAAVALAKDHPDCPFLPERREDVKYEEEAVKEFFRAENVFYGFAYKLWESTNEANHEKLMADWEAATESC